MLFEKFNFNRSINYWRAEIIFGFYYCVNRVVLCVLNLTRDYIYRILRFTVFFNAEISVIIAVVFYKLNAVTTEVGVFVESELAGDSPEIIRLQIFRINIFISWRSNLQMKFFAGYIQIIISVVFSNKCLEVYCLSGTINRLIGIHVSSKSIFIVSEVNVRIAENGLAFSFSDKQNILAGKG